MKKYIIIFTVIGVALLAGCAKEATSNSLNGSVSSNEPFMQTAMPKDGDTIAVITTNQGVMKAVLFSEKTDETVKNFTELAASDKFDGTIFHRVIKNFMI